MEIADAVDFCCSFNPGLVNEPLDVMGGIFNVTLSSFSNCRQRLVRTVPFDAITKCVEGILARLCVRKNGQIVNVYGPRSLKQLAH